MKRTYLAGLALIVVFASWMPAAAGDVAGQVTDNGGRGVQGIHISFKDPSGALAASTESDKDGNYQISGLGGGTYSATLDPGKTGYRGTTVAVSVDPKQVLCVNWFVSPSTEALAVARPNNAAGASTNAALAAAACRAEDPPTALSAGAQILLAGGLGASAAAAAGAFNGVTNSPPKRSQRRPGD